MIVQKRNLNRFKKVCCQLFPMKANFGYV